MRPVQSSMAFVFALGFLGTVASLSAREAPINEHLKKGLSDKAASFWIYDDMVSARAQAKSSGKPLLVTVRCVP